MILYTPLSPADIFPPEENDTKRQLVMYQGKPLYVEQVDTHSYELIQLLSTDPQDYLNSQLNPGNILS